jgi:hypothetical protein
MPQIHSPSAAFVCDNVLYHTLGVLAIRAEDQSPMVAATHCERGGDQSRNGCAGYLRLRKPAISIAGSEEGADRKPAISITGKQAGDTQSKRGMNGITFQPS